MIKIDVIIPSYRSEKLTAMAIKSFEKHKGRFDLRYIVVENAGDESYKDNILSLNDNVVWLTNDCKHRFAASETNAEAVTKGLELVESDLVFICHNDVVACHPDWMEFLYSKLLEGNSIAGTVLDNTRINAVHISGLLTTTELAKSVSLYPVYKDDKIILDVGDTITQHCREKALKYFCCRNTFNDESHEQLCKEPYKSLHHIDRALDSDNNVIFSHLGRGSSKTLGVYWKANRMNLDGWVDFVESNIL